MPRALSLKVPAPTRVQSPPKLAGTARGDKPMSRAPRINAISTREYGKKPEPAAGFGLTGLTGES